MKKIIVFLFCLYSCTCFAAINDAPVKNILNTTCQQAVPTTDPGFCSSFKSVASCHCIAMGLPPAACQDMNTLYARMIGMYGSVAKACNSQKDTSPQTCMDDWKCYREGGRDSQNGLCSSTGSACQ